MFCAILLSCLKNLPDILSSDRVNLLKFELEGGQFSQKFWDHLNNLFKQWKVKTIFETELVPEGFSDLKI